MGHRKQLRNVAGGIVSSFKSRNNDVDGYWELGKLYKFAVATGVDTIQLDLLNLLVQPTSDEFMPLVRMWRSKLDYHLNSCHIPIIWIKSAVVIARFNQEYVKKYHYWGSALGDPCTCTCEITTDIGKVYAVSSGTNCKPHNVEKECRSTRRNDF